MYISIFPCPVSQQHQICETKECPTLHALFTQDQPCLHDYQWMEHTKPQIPYQATQAPTTTLSTFSAHIRTSRPANRCYANQPCHHYCTAMHDKKHKSYLRFILKVVLAFKSGFPFSRFSVRILSSSTFFSSSWQWYQTAITHYTLTKTHRQHTFCACSSALSLVILCSSFSSSAVSSSSLHTKTIQGTHHVVQQLLSKCAHSETNTDKLVLDTVLSYKLAQQSELTQKWVNTNKVRHPLLEARFQLWGWLSLLTLGTHAQQEIQHGMYT